VEEAVGAHVNIRLAVGDGTETGQLYEGAVPLGEAVGGTGQVFGQLLQGGELVPTWEAVDPSLGMEGEFDVRDTVSATEMR